LRVGTFPPDVTAAAQASHAKWNIPASVTLAQWAVESYWGTRMPKDSNNPFGIKAVGDQPYVEAHTREEIKGESVTIVAHFRRFDSIADAFDQHGKLLATAKPYARARTFANDPDAFADALTGVYATDHRYGAILKSRMKQYNLYQYD
jgi:flagellum-specific peptidoglycan hydrolase FlgJ